MSENSGKTRTFSVASDKELEMFQIMSTVYASLKENGYDPINQIEDYSPIQTIDESKVTKDEPESEESEENEDETSTEQTDSDDNDASQSDDVSNSADN